MRERQNIYSNLCIIDTADSEPEICVLVLLLVSAYILIINICKNDAIGTKQKQNNCLTILSKSKLLLN